MPRTRQGKIVLKSWFLHFSYQDFNMILHLQDRATHSASKIVLISWWLHLTHQDINTIFDRQNRAASPPGDCGKPAGKSPQNDPSFERITYEILPVWRDPFWKIQEGTNYCLCVFFRMSPQIPEFQRSVLLMNFCSKAQQMATVSPQKNQQKNPRHGGNMQNQLFSGKFEGGETNKTIFKMQQRPFATAFGKN